jgi:hypothetical protein
VPGTGSEGRAGRRRAARTILFLTAAPGLVWGPARAAGAAAAPAPDLVAFARAVNAAWNAHDLDRVAAYFAPGATIRQMGVRFAVAAADGSDPPVVEDVYGAGPRSLAAAQDGGGWPGDDVLWAAGPPRIRTWLPWLFAAGHRVEASAYRAAGDTVTWRYRAFADPYQRFAGVGPAEGTAALVVRGGRIFELTVASDGYTVARRARQFNAEMSARIAARAAAPPDGSAAPGRGGGAGPRPAGAPDARLLLGLAAAAGVGLLVRARRRRLRTGWRPAP